MSAYALPPIQEPTIQEFIAQATWAVEERIDQIARARAIVAKFFRVLPCLTCGRQYSLDPDKARVGMCCGRYQPIEPFEVRADSPAVVEAKEFQ
jgi:hypothetical protein